MRGRDPGRPEPGYGAQGRRDHGHLGEKRDGHLPVGIRGNIRAFDLLVRFDTSTAAGAIDQPHDGKAKFEGSFLAPAHLVAHCAVGGAAADREVVAANDDPAALDEPSPGDEIGRGQAGQSPGFVVDRLAGQRTDFSKRSGVEQSVDALPDREAPGLHVPGHTLFAPHLRRQGLSVLNLFEFGFPTHGDPGFKAVVLDQPGARLAEEAEDTRTGPVGIEAGWIIWPPRHQPAFLPQRLPLARAPGLRRLPRGSVAHEPVLVCGKAAFRAPSAASRATSVQVSQNPRVGTATPEE